MNPYGVGGVFQTNSDQSANSFRDPMNIAHLYPGWRNNPNYQTPAHDALYRPAYQGPNPYAAYDKPTFMGGISQLYSPFATDPYWGNPVDNQAGAFNSTTTKPFDASARIGQRFIAPAVVYGVSQAVFGNMGRSMGLGMAAGLGLNSGGMAAGAMGFAGNFALPIAIGTGVMAAVERGVFQPYIRSRQMAEVIADSFSGITYASGGNAISGRGLSRGQSAQMGSAVDRMGIMDPTFSSNQFGGIAAMGMRAGLFDDVNGAGDITKRVSSIAAQIKTILAISRDPNIANAIEELGKLRLGGASITGGVASQAMSAYSSIGMYASSAGASVQRVMNTVGSQGQYMFQMNGLTPYLGQVAAASAYSGFASAQRMGLLSTAQLARMGGVEGATQSALGAQLSASSTMFNRMGLVNQFSGRGGDSSVAGTITTFGGLASRDPLGMMGAMELYGNSMASSQMKTHGAGVAENQAIAYLKSVGRQPGANGLYSAHEVAAVMKSQGYTSEQIQAYASLRIAQTNPDNVAQNIRAFKAQGKEQLYQVIAQEDLYAGPIGTTIAGIKRFGRRAMSRTADAFAYPVNQMAGAMGDTGMSWFDSLMFGSTYSDQNRDNMGTKGLDMNAIDPVLSKKHSLFAVGSRIEQGSVSSPAYTLLSRIDKAARQGGPGSEFARRLLDVGFDGQEGKELIAKFLALQPETDMKDAYTSLSTSTRFLDTVAGMAKGKIVNVGDANSASAKDNRLLDMAAEVHSSGGPLAVSLGKILADPRYAELNKTLTGTTDEKISKINAMTRQRLRNMDFTPQAGASEASLSAAYRALRRGKTQEDEANRDAKTGTDWQTAGDAFTKIDSGAQTFLEAVMQFKRVVEEPNFANRFMRNLGIGDR